MTRLFCIDNVHCIVIKLVLNRIKGGKICRMHRFPSAIKKKSVFRAYHDPVTLTKRARREDNLEHINQERWKKTG